MPFGYDTSRPDTGHGILDRVAPGYTNRQRIAGVIGRGLSGFFLGPLGARLYGRIQNGYDNAHNPNQNDGWHPGPVTQFPQYTPQPFNGYGSGSFSTTPLLNPSVQGGYQTLPVQGFTGDNNYHTTPILHVNTGGFSGNSSGGVLGSGSAIDPSQWGMTGIGSAGEAGNSAAYAQSRLPRMGG